MHVWKGHGLGNDYLVVEGQAGPPSANVVRALCDRHRGVGSDGLLVADTTTDPVGLRIFNPDATEAEKSGNGLRIFGAWLYLTGRADDAPFRVRLPGEIVEMEVEGEGAPGFIRLRVDMGRASFRAGDLHFTGAEADAEVMGEPIDIDGESLAIHLVSMGNPHCVVFRDQLDPADLRRLAPRLQAHPSFSRGVNVQFARVAGPGRLEALIWERGAGETLASGSSACAVTVAARRSGRTGGDAFVVGMEGGEVEVELSADYDVRLRGEAGIVFEATVRDDVVRGWR